MNVVFELYSSILYDANFEKKSSSWYRRTAEVTATINLQRSRFAPNYLCNIGFWIQEIKDVRYPNASSCHVYQRFEDLLCEKDGVTLQDLLDLEYRMKEERREREITRLVNTYLLPHIDRGMTVHGLQEMNESGLLGLIIRQEAKEILEARK